MSANNIKSAWRNLLKNKITSIINISGLTLGLSSAVLAILFASHELSFEECHKKTDQLYKVYVTGDFGQLKWIPNTFGPEGKELKDKFPEIEKSSISRLTGGTVIVGDHVFNEDRILFADQTFFSLFTIHFKKGHPSEELQSIVISAKTANRYFGEDNPIGQFISINTNGVKADFKVSGVYDNLPSNTHLQCEFIIPFSFSKRFGDWRNNEYNSTEYSTYLKLSKGTDFKKLNKKIQAQFIMPVNVDNAGVFLMPIKEIHFKGLFENNKEKLFAFLIGGLFVLITSILNYINLTNIIYFKRRKEIGIRKVNGGLWKNVFSHFFSDTALITFLCFMAALLLIIIILPWFNSLMDTHIVVSFNFKIIGLCLLIYFITVILSGIYPSLRFSFLKPVNLLGNESTGYKGSSWSRYLLSSFQFILSIIFIQFILLMNKQGNYLEDENHTGYNAQNVLCISGYQWGDLNNVKNELLKNPAIEYVSWGSQMPSMGISTSMNWREENNKITASIYHFEDDYLKVFKIKMLKGHFFSNEYPSEKKNGVVVNQEVAEILGYKDPIGKQVMVRNKNYTIIGLINNYMCHPPIFETGPLIILPGRNTTDYLLMKIKDTDKIATINYITGVLKNFNSEYPIDLKYHGDYIYSQKEARSFITTYQLMKLFFMLTIIMTLVGLFGLSIFIANKNIKEIGIRKACGASVYNMIFKLLHSLIIQVFIAVSIATPLVYLFSKGYLSTFPNGINPGFLFYFAGGGIAVALLALTVSWQTWRTARTNPVVSLRYE